MNNQDAGSDGFARRLRELRKKKNLSQSELGSLVGIHYTHVGRYEKGTSRPSADTLKRMASALDVTGDYLMEGSVNDMARSRLEDQELMAQFQEVEMLGDEEKKVVKIFLDAFLTKRKLRQLAG